MSKVTLFVRYKKLTLWNKISFWGAVASFIGIPLTLVLYLIPQSERNGGDSFAYFIPQTHLYMSTTEPPSYNDVELFLMHSGKQPLYDIQIKLVDIQKSRQLMSEHLKLPTTLAKYIDATETIGEVPRLDPGRGKSVFKLDLPANVDRYNYSAFFVARNGGWAQELRFIRNKDRHWGLASRTTRNGKVLQEDGGVALPKDDSGKPKWN